MGQRQAEMDRDFVVEQLTYARLKDENGTAQSLHPRGCLACATHGLSFSVRRLPPAKETLVALGLVAVAHHGQEPHGHIRVVGAGRGG
jgi:hypothetical protein